MPGTQPRRRLWPTWASRELARFPRSTWAVSVNQVVTETRIYIGISTQKPSNLFACRWLRAPATTEIARRSMPQDGRSSPSIAQDVAATRGRHRVFVVASGPRVEEAGYAAGRGCSSVLIGHEGPAQRIRPMPSRHVEG